MRTVDLLMSARELLSDRSNWTQTALHNYFSNRDKNCFCVMGSILKEGGALMPSTIGGFFYTRRGAEVSSDGSLVAITVNGERVLSVNIDGLPTADLAILQMDGFYPKTILNAVRYLRAAAEDIHPAVVNDQYGYDAVMTMLNIAIKNAKRRHVRGDH